MPATAPRCSGTEEITENTTLSENWRPGLPPDGYPYDGQDRYGRHDGDEAFKGSVHGPGEPPAHPGGYPVVGGYPAPPGAYALESGHAMQPYPQYPPYPPYPPYPGGEATPTSAITALVVSILMVATCCGVLGVVGLVFSALAVTEKRDPEKIRRFTRNAWISNGVVLGLMLLCIVYVVIVGTLSET